METLIEQQRAEHPTWSDLVLHRWSEGKQQLDPNFLTSRSMGRLDWQPVVPAIACPTLLIVADPGKGGIVTPEVADMAAFDFGKRYDLVLCLFSSIGIFLRYINGGSTIFSISFHG